MSFQKNFSETVRQQIKDEISLVGVGGLIKDYNLSESTPDDEVVEKCVAIEVNNYFS